jgi:two-component system, NarL family, sensor kinase
MDAYEISIYTAFLIAGLFVTGLLGLYLVSVIRHQKQHAELQRHYFLQEITVLEKERTRVARDLHDELAPLLSLAKYQVDNSAQQESLLLEKASQNLLKVMLRLGEIAANLNADKLVQKGLCFALKDFLLEVESISRLQIEFTYDVQRPVPAATAIHFYRMAQEIVQNVVKHAAATRLYIRLKEKKNKLYFSFSDNGKGFAFEESFQQRKGIGLQSIHSRVVLLGGSFRCTSAPGEGTRYSFEFPF